MVSPSNFIFLALLLFIIGWSGLFLRREPIRIFFSFQLMFGSVVLLFVVFGRQHVADAGSVISLVLLGVMFAQGIVGLGLWMTKNRLSRSGRFQNGERE